ncbi:MAG: N(1)-aminopropylagmatine ureohydrolase [Methanonatronarchaeales archaeon]|nr:N(1)-aminopropylagmatine ureohydrolase [Methanonatronarchaeales archaeon]
MHLTFGPAREGKDRYTVTGVPYENPSFRVGASGAPNAVRTASKGIEPYVHRKGIDLRDIPLADAGDLPRAPHGDLPLHVDPDGEFPVFLGGDHSITPHLVDAFFDDEVTVVSLDAHLDYRDEFRGDPDSNACSSRRIEELDVVSEVVVVGARSGAEEEWSYPPKHVRSDEVADEPGEVGDRISDEFDRIYLSIDMDVFDPSHAPAVGNPEPMGLEPAHVRTLVDAMTHRIVGVDVVEVVPGIDDGNTALLAAWTVREVLAAVEVSR